MKPAVKHILIYCASTLAASALLLIAARGSAAFAEWYAYYIFPVFAGTVGRLFSPLFFSVAELLLLLLVVALAALLLYAAVKRSWQPLLWLARFAPCALCTLLLIYTLTAGVNYSRVSIAQSVGVSAREASVEELRQLYLMLAQQAAELAPQTARYGEGHFSLLVFFTSPHIEGSQAEQRRLERQMRPPARARQSMAALGRRYPALDLYYPNPKPVLFSRAMSWLNLAGVYSPFTIEANYNRDMPELNIPFSMCHELAHLAGYMREDEANFIAYLACQSRADDVAFRYSGVFTALIYVLNALYSAVPPEEYAALYALLPPQLQTDLRYNDVYWQAFAGPAAEIALEVNDYYLKANLQAEGVQSYGRFVDLLLAYYLPAERAH